MIAREHDLQGIALAVWLSQPPRAVKAGLRVAPGPMNSSCSEWYDDLRL